MPISKLFIVSALALVFVASSAFANGSIAGTISFVGARPKKVKLNRKSDPVCATTQEFDSTIKLSKDGKALANVHVRIVKNAPASGILPTEPIVIDQKECIFIPRVQGAVEGQKVFVKNGDGTLHNVHAYNGTKTIFNQAQPPNTKPLEKDLRGNEVVKIKCDVHPWMAAYVIFSKHPYFSTSNDEGKFEIRDVPEGTYTVEAWHEKLGTQTTEVTVDDQKIANLRFTFSDKKK